jgi:hypothetical protein
VGKQEIVLENGDGERYDWMNSPLSYRRVSYSGQIAVLNDRPVEGSLVGARSRAERRKPE